MVDFSDILVPPPKKIQDVVKTFSLEGKMVLVFQIGREEHKRCPKYQARNLAAQLYFFHANANMNRLVW